MAEDTEPLDLERPPLPDDRARGPMSRWPLVGFIALAALAGFGAVGWYAYDRLGHRPAEGVAPLIRAADGPIKVRPAEPGGMRIPDRDKEVLKTPTERATEERVERLLPPPEEPVAPPPAEVAPPAPINPPPPPVAAEPKPPSEAAMPPAPSPDELPPAIRPAPAAGEAPQAPPSAPPAKPAQEAQEAQKAHETQKAQEAAAPAPEQPEAAPAQTAAVPPPPLRAAGAWRIQIGALRSDSDARARWQRLKRANADLLAGLDPQIERVDLGAGKGVFYRLQTGPFADQAKADALCDALKDRKLGCFVVRP